MKSLFVLFFLIFTLNSRAEKIEQAIITSIDDYDNGKNYVEVSEEGLPPMLYVQLLNLIDHFKFTVAPEETFRNQFEILKKDSRARARNPGGNCSVRRAYIQNLLKKKNIETGKILINCPGFNGRLRLQDQVSGHWYSFANFHDTNVVAAETPAGRTLMVLDLQFLDAPVTLHEYLTIIEASQKIRPKKTRDTGTRFCYWTISTPHLTY